MQKSAYFISDLHLGARIFQNDLSYEKRVVRWLDSIKETVSELYLLGDIFDYWYEYKYVVPKGHVRFLGKLAELSDNGVKIYWFIGNHDIWLFDYLPSEIGLTVIDGYAVKDIMGHKFFLSHGDGIGKISNGFKFIRGLFRNKICQSLYSSIHPRWTMPFALYCSLSSRKSHKKSDKASPVLAKLKSFANEYLSTDNSIEYFVFGHLHIILNEQINSHSSFIILGDWITHFSYGKFDGTKFTIDQFDN